MTVDLHLCADGRCQHVGRSGWRCGNRAEPGEETCGMHRPGAHTEVALAPVIGWTCGVPNRTYRGGKGLACPNPVSREGERCWRHLGEPGPARPWRKLVEPPMRVERLNLPRCLFERGDGTRCFTMVETKGQRCRFHRDELCMLAAEAFDE
jgi:hypothetical protein